MLTPLSLLTCLMTCLLFAAGNIESPLCFFPLSASCGYAYGLFLLVRSGGVLALVKQHYFLLVGWLASIVLTVLVSIARTREIVAGLPDSPPQDCFIVTAAARGHHAIVGSCIDRATGRLTNDQLASFRAFEDWLIAHTPRLHRAARSVYNVIAPPIARSIIFRWQADLLPTVTVTILPGSTR